MRVMMCFFGAISVALTACQPAPNHATENDEQPLSAPWLFWEGQLRVHAVQFCDARWQVQSADIWQQGSIILPCQPSSSLHVSSTLENRHYVETVAKWLALPSRSFTQSKALLRETGVINERNEWQWGEGRVVLMNGALGRDEQTLDELWHWHQLDRQAQTQGGAVQLLFNRDDLSALAGDVQFNGAMEQSLKKLRLSASDAFGLNSEWGRWLRQQSVALKYNDVLLSQVMWTTTLTATFSDVESVAATLRSGLHTRFRLYTDAHLAQLLRHVDSAESHTLSAAEWRTVQEQWQIRQWLTSAPLALDGVTEIGDKAWLWQDGRLQTVAARTAP